MDYKKLAREILNKTKSYQEALDRLTEEGVMAETALIIVEKVLKELKEEQDDDDAIGQSPRGS